MCISVSVCTLQAACCLLPVVVGFVLASPCNTGDFGYLIVSVAAVVVGERFLLPSVSVLLWICLEAVNF